MAEHALNWGANSPALAQSCKRVNIGKAREIKHFSAYVTHASYVSVPQSQERMPLFGIVHLIEIVPSFLRTQE